MSHHSSRVQGLHAQEEGDEVNLRNQAPLNVAPEVPENIHLLPLPPRAPAPIDLAAILQQQNQLLQVLVTTLTAQAQGNLGNNRPAMHHGNGSRIADFNHLQPPKFGGSDNPIEADNWLREIEMKLEVVHVDDRDKVLLAVQQLRGPALAWW
jgi:hypothetical protein